MKRFLSLSVCIVFCLATLSCFASSAINQGYSPLGTGRLYGRKVLENFSENAKDKTTVTMYAQDGRTLEVLKDEVTLYQSVGWYLEPFVTMYAQDGRTLNVLESEVTLYQSVGWYLEPFVTMYAQDGRTLNVLESEVTLYQSVGWYLEPFVTMYAQDGRTLNVLESEVTLYESVGWYKSVSEIPNYYGKMVALTFDDGPSKKTNIILDCLDKHNAKATFFVVGRSVNAYPDVVRRAYSMGMEIGNHTMTHADLKTLSASGIKTQINNAENAIVNAIGVHTKLVRPPYGSYNKTVSNAAGKPLILWSIDTLDWKTRNADKTVKSVLENVKDGSIVLMHDLYSQTADAAVRIIPELIKRGYKLVTVSELAKAKGIEMVNGKNYSSFK